MLNVPVEFRNFYMGETRLGDELSLSTDSRYFFAIFLFYLMAVGDGQLLNRTESILCGDCIMT